jgi:hypothetical protein
MKLSRIIILLCVVLVAVSSCKITRTTKELRTMNIIFDSLKRSDYTIVGNLTAEATVTKKNGKLDKQYWKSYKWGETNELMSYRGGLRQFTVPQYTKVDGKFVMTGYRVLSSTFIHDPAPDFALYALMEKYPDIDYLINVRMERLEIIASGKTTETIKVKADGIKLKTDK